MNLLDVSFGIFAFLPQGWIFMLFIILIEYFITTRYLKNKWHDQKILFVTTLSNTISGLFGIITTMILNGGWFLVVWFPWVSDHEINLNKAGALKYLIIFYLIAFLASVLIEVAINIRFLHKNYANKRIIIATLLANTASYIIGSTLLYTYSFSH